MNKERMMAGLTADIIREGFVLMLAAFVLAIGIKTANVALIIVGVLAIILYVFFILETSMKFKSVSELLAGEYLYLENFDKADIVKKTLDEKTRFDHILDMMFYIGIFVFPIVSGILIVVGVIIDSYIIALVIPGWILAIFAIYLVVQGILKKRNKASDSDFITEKSVIAITKNSAFIKGDLYRWNTLGIKVIVEYAEEEKKLTIKEQLFNIPFASLVFKDIDSENAKKIKEGLI